MYIIIHLIVSALTRAQVCSTSSSMHDVYNACLSRYNYCILCHRFIDLPSLDALVLFKLHKGLYMYRIATIAT